MFQESKGYVAVIGGIGVDLHARPLSGGFDRHTSTPSKVTLTAGGVGRNIAVDLAFLGVPVRLLGVTGDDPLSDFALADAAAAGVDVRNVSNLSETQGGVYLALLGQDGNLEAAAADLSAIEQLGNAYLERYRSEIAGATLIVTETNLLGGAIQTIIDIANDAEVPVIIDPVSVGKTQRLQGLTGRVFAFTPNEDEAAAFERIDCRLEFDHTIMTLGSRGLRWSAGESDTPRTIPAVQTDQVDVTGAGDAFVAGFVAALYQGKPVEEALTQGAETAARVVATASSTLEHA